MSQPLGLDESSMGPPRGPTTRRETRIVALQALYEADVAGRDPMAVLERRAEEDALSPSAKVFARKLVAGALENRERLDNIISTFAPSWPIDQMAIVDRNLLRMAVYEMMLGGETPPKVAINEAVELAKIFGSESSPRFVNGVLGSVIETAER